MQLNLSSGILISNFVTTLAIKTSSVYRILIRAVSGLKKKCIKSRVRKFIFVTKSLIPMSSFVNVIQQLSDEYKNDFQQWHIKRMEALKLLLLQCFIIVSVV